jgi:hypothetical protein
VGVTPDWFVQLGSKMDDSLFFPDEEMAAADPDGTGVGTGFS